MRPIFNDDARRAAAAAAPPPLYDARCTAATDAPTPAGGGGNGAPRPTRLEWLQRPAPTVAPPVAMGPVGPIGGGARKEPVVYMVGVGPT
eukprot:m.258981 g.258981  ORF g.258981 m.258981 type:complete len:90 (+) comp81540_c0_seq1:1-270(+)